MGFVGGWSRVCVRLGIAIAIAGALVLATSVAQARPDELARTIHELATSDSFKLRLSDALALDKANDPRAIVALANALQRDSSPAIRRVAAVRLSHIDVTSTADDTVQAARSALIAAKTNDSDRQVRLTAGKSLGAIDLAIANANAPAARNEPHPANAFVYVDDALDKSKQAGDATQTLTKIVRSTVKRRGFATEWPGGTPTGSELAAAGARAYLVSASITDIKIVPVHHSVEVHCTVALRMSPWTGKDSGERWSAGKSATATGSAKALVNKNAVGSGIVDCVEAIAEQLVERQVAPFITQLENAKH